MILNKSKIMIIFIIIFLGASAVSGVTISQDNYQESKNNVSILYSGEILDQSLDGWSTSSTSWWFDTQYNAQGFKPTVNKITKLGVPLRRTSGTSGLNFYISLYDDNNGKPGSFLKGGGTTI